MSSPQVMFENMPHPDPAPKVDWSGHMEKIAAGDQTALAQFYDATNRLAFGLILRMLNNRAIAEEILLDVYTQVWRQATHYNHERGTPLAWLMTIARSRALDKLRASKQELSRKESLDVVSDARSSDADPEQMASSSEQQRIVRHALAALSSEQRQVIELAYFSGLSHSEIAAQLGQPLGTVKTRVRLGMIKLKEALSPLRSGH